MIRRIVLAGALTFATLGLATSASAQAPSTTTIPELPRAHIIPPANSGHAPEDAGDRGGALQLAVLAILVVGIGGGVAYVVHQSRAARAGD